MEEVLGRVRARDLHAVDAGTRSRVARLEAELEAELAVAVGVEIAALGGPI